MTIAAPSFAYIQESEAFAALFPHRFDFIYANHPQPHDPVNWQTESRYPLADRALQQGNLLYGVRFGSETCYGMLDIDSGSAYHPQRDRFAVGRILAALEPIGLTAYLVCTSSYSGGIHVYLPLQTSIASWELAAAVSTLLENAGFQIGPGQLEIFPNPKPYISEGNPSLFNAHRLPLQAGSYLLDADFQPIWSDRHRFVQQWQWVQQRNQLDRKALRQILRSSRQKLYRFSGKADKFIRDLNTEIELGWTGAGQTNRLLGRIALREYIFHHVLAGGEPLTGQALVNEIVRVARSLPGYTDWCRHQSEIEQRAAEWARCVEASHYFHYGSTQGKYKPADTQDDSALEQPLRSWNQQQSDSARSRIQAAIATLLEQETLPAGATARFRLLTQFGIGGASLYRHRDLWHPAFLQSEPVENQTAFNTFVENPPDPPHSFKEERMDAVEPSIRSHPTSLLSATGSNTALQAAFSAVAESELEYAGSNSLCCLRSPLVDRVRSSGCSPQASEQCSFEFACHSPSDDLFRDDLSRNDLSRNDLSEVLVSISVQIRRLRWSPQRVCDRLLQLFSKPSQALLKDWELQQWLQWLEDHP
ncbi:hypothetical protein IFO70_13165 [Phormidium tenue FACHB-886]|nr:hypothetical protein [Phormidium tenue FACHB-886]